MQAIQRISGKRLSLGTYREDGPGLLVRCVGDTVLDTVVDVPGIDPTLLTQWMSGAANARLGETGDIDALPFARVGWKGYTDVRAQANTWLEGEGLPADLLEGADVCLMGCRGAPFHADAAFFGEYAFVVCWLSEDEGYDLVFPHLDKRIALQRGTVVLFDGSQVHGVVPRGALTYDGADVKKHWPIQLFLSWELVLGETALSARLGVETHVQAEGDPEPAVTLDGVAVEVDSTTGDWHKPVASLA